jgi:hypothetical protein
MQQQAVTVQFAILDPPPSLSIGQPVTVVARSGKPESGIVLPREAVVRGGNGETLVWRHAEPSGSSHASSGRRRSTPVA